MSLDTLRQMFFEEARENLELAESCLLRLEKDPASSEILNEVFRAIHTIKGNSGTFGFPSITSIAHDMETRLETARDGSHPLTTKCLEQLLERHDLLAAEVRSLFGQGEDVPPASDTSGHHEPQQALAATTFDQGHWSVGIFPEPDFYEKGNDMVLILSALSDARTTSVDLSKLPNLEDLNPLVSYLSWQVRIPPEVSENSIREPFLWAEDVCRLEIARESARPSDPTSVGPVAPTRESQEPIAPFIVPAVTEHVAVAAEAPAEFPHVTPEPRAKLPKPGASSREQAEAQVLKIPIERLDRLVNQIAELSIAQSLFLRGADPLDPAVERLQQALWSVQETVLDVRMQPIKYIFQRLPRLVRTLAKELSKSVELTIEGEETELDKVLLDGLVDPLVHLVRNAIDHGLEPPDERIRCGKTAEGNVTISASYRGGRVLIEVTDDGAGIDPERLRQKALKLGWLSEEDSLTPEEVFDFIFQPGFSTATAVSAISGRGVGLDVVKQNLTFLGGSIAVQSVLGSSTTFQLSLPLTLAMLDVQSVTAGDFTFYVPLDGVVECLAWNEKRLKEIGHEHFYSFRDRFIRVERLDTLLGYAAEERLEGSILVVVESAGGLAGLVVDEILQQERVVVKSLEKNFRHVRGILGAAVSKEGRVVPILDAVACFEKFRRKLRLV